MNGAECAFGGFAAESTPKLSSNGLGSSSIGRRSAEHGDHGIGEGLRIRGHAREPGVVPDAFGSHGSGDHRDFRGQGIEGLRQILTSSSDLLLDTFGIPGHVIPLDTQQTSASLLQTPMD